MIALNNVPKIPTASVVAVIRTNDLDAVFKNTGSKAKVIAAARDQDLILFDSNVNEVKSFTHEVLADNSKGIGKNVEINIDIIDPTYKFEDHFLSIGYKSLYGSNIKVLEEIERVKKLKQPKESFQITDLRSKTEATKLEKTRLGREIAALESAVKNHKYDFWFWYKNGDNKLQFATLTSAQVALENYKKKIKESETLHQTYAKSLKELIDIEEVEFLNTIQNSIDNLSNAVSPTVLFFYGVGDNPDSWAGPVQGTLGYIRYAYNGDAGEKILKLKYFASDTLFSNAREKVFYTGLDRNVNVSLPMYKDGEFLDRHFLVTSLIKEYLHKCNTVPRDNILVLFPDLTVLTSDQYLNCYSAASALMTKGLGSFNWADYITPQGTLDKRNSAILSSMLTKLPMGANHNLYERLGFNIYFNPLAESEEDIDATLTTGIPRITVTTSAAGLFDWNYPENFAVGLNKNALETTQDVLAELINKIRKNISQPLGTMELFFENDPQVKDIYIKARPYLTDFDPSQPLLIFGDIPFIMDYFYAVLGEYIYTNKGNMDRVSNYDDWILLADRIKAMKSLIVPEVTKDSPFDSIFYSLPDEFAYSASGGNVKSNRKQIKTDIANQKVPIFIHGYENSNILNFDIDWDLQYYGALNDGFKPSLSDTTSQGSVSQKKLNNSLERLKELGAKSLDPENVKSLVTRIQSILVTGAGGEKGQIRLIKNTFKEAIPSLNDDYVQGLAEQLIIAVKNSKHGNLTTSEFVNNAIVNKMSDLVRKISEFALFARIQTVPLFRFYHMAHSMHFNCFMFIRESAVIGQQDKIQKLPSLLSGAWSIVGFKHTISESDISSTFVLIRQPSYQPHKYNFEDDE